MQDRRPLGKVPSFRGRGDLGEKYDQGPEHTLGVVRVTERTVAQEGAAGRRRWTGSNHVQEALVATYMLGLKEKKGARTTTRFHSLQVNLRGRPTRTGSWFSSLMPLVSRSALGT